MSIKIYKDTAANSIFIEDANGAQFLNSLQASLSDSSQVTISDLARQIDIVSNADHADFVDENDAAYTGDSTAVCNTLNSIFQSSGTPSSELPNITSNLSVSSVQGATINYELTADYGVGYEWDLSSVPGVTTVEGNPRKLIGGSGLASGTYVVPVKAINYNGEDSKNVTLTVSAPPFANTRSIQFQQNDYLNANGGILQNILGRSANGSGSTDAWSIACYFKAGSSNNQSQTILYFGGSDVTNGHHLRLYWNGNNSIRQSMALRYGSNNNHLQFFTPVGSLSNDGQWHHIMATYDGGTTGSGSGSLSGYYSRFKMFVDGNQVTTTNSHANYGTTTSLIGPFLRVGRQANGSGYLRNSCKIDELAVWGSDQSANISSIYNGGVPVNMSNLTDEPEHWWRMGDGDSYPNLADSGSEANAYFIMSNMTSADIVNDVP